MKLVLVSVLLCMFYCGVSSAPDKIVCYHGSWSGYRLGDGKFTVEDIDPFKCTHLVYTFVGIGADGSIRVLDPWNDIDLKGFKRFNDLKLQNPKLKTLVAIGGWNEGSETFSKVAANSNLRLVFAVNALKFIQEHGFDGFDLDWEYPAQRGGSPGDVANFAALIRLMREKFDASGKKYLLTAAVGATATAADLSYDVPALSTYLDFINLMAYDFHGAFDGLTGQNAPLHPSSIETSPSDLEKNVEASVKAWIQRGADPNKLVLGLGVYGRSFTLTNINNHELGAPASAGLAGPHTAEPGMLAYFEICMMQKQGGWTDVWDDVQKVPYAYNGDQWVGYDNVRSIKLKVDFAKSLNLGGLMIWSIEMEDFNGKCGPKYPILSAIAEAMGNSGGTEPTPPTEGTKPTEATPPPGEITTQDPGNEVSCVGHEGSYIPDPKNCARYYFCGEDGRIYEFNCAPGLFYDPKLGYCVYENEFECNV